MNPSNTPNRRWRFLQFRLWHMLALITMVAIPVGIYTQLERSAVRREEAIAIVKNFGSRVDTEQAGFEWLPQRYRTQGYAVGPAIEYELGIEDNTKAFAVEPTQTTKHDKFAKSSLRIVESVRPSAKEFFAALSQLHHLRELNFNGVGLRDIHIDLFNRKWPLKKLHVSAGKLTEKGFQNLTCYDELQELDLSWSQFNDSQLQHLRSFPKLAKLSLEGSNVNDAHLIHIGRIASLEELDLRTTEVHGHGLAQFSGLENLRTLQLSSPVFPVYVWKPEDVVREMNLATMPELPSLRNLSIDGFSDEIHATLNEQSLKAIGRQTSLESLELEYCDFEDESSRHLSQLSLRHVSVGDGSISIRGLRNIANVHSIEYLLIRRSGDFTPDELAKFITDADKLNEIIVIGVPRSDALIDAICHSPNLTSVQLLDADLSPQDVRRINDHPTRQPIDADGY